MIMMMIMPIVKKMDKKHRRMVLASITIALILGGMFWHCLPDPLFDDPYSTVIVDQNGELLGATIADDEQWRFPPETELPERYILAVTTFEDKRFFQHRGVDPLAVVRAIGLLAAKGRIVSGASTITMQLIRMSRKGKPRNLKEKIIESIVALRVELTMDKGSILAMYASHAPFGGNVVGIRAASWRYFGRSPENLTWAEAAMLAVLPNSPSLIHPGKNRTRLLAKRNGLLQRLHDNGLMDAMAFKLALAEPLPPRPRAIPLHAPHLLHRVASKQDADDSTGQTIIHTTLKKTLQVRARDILQHNAQILAGNEIHNAAAIIMEVDTGNVLAYVGNVASTNGQDHGNQVDIIPAPRSTGSILKPFLYAGMIQAGEVLPSQLVKDVPSRFQGFAPENYSRTYHGAVPAYMALARSLNIPAVRMLQQYGVDRFYALAKDMGMTTLNRPADDYGLSLILGGAEGSLWDVTGIYAAMARRVNQYADASLPQSNYAQPTYLMGRPSHQKKQIVQKFPLDAPACYQTFEALLEVGRPGADSAWRNFSSSQKIAWKTGTSYGYRDAWAVGVTPQYAVGVWVGNADGEGRPDLTGTKAAAPILFDLFGILESSQWFPKPENDLHDMVVCAHSGFRAGIHCAKTRLQSVAAAGLRSRPCPYCRVVHCDAQKKWQVHSDCDRVADMVAEKWFVLSGDVEFYYKQNHSDYRPLPDYRADCYETPEDQAVSPLSVLYPVNRCQIYVPVELDGKAGKTVFEAAHRNPEAVVFWHLDENYLGKTRDVHQMALTPNPGDHILTLVDQDGEMVRKRFTVLAKS